MKKLFAVAAAAAALSSAPAFANDTVIYASIAPICYLTGPANNGSVNLNGSTLLGDATAQCNSPGGFTASLTSLNGFKLKDQGNPVNVNDYPYKLSIPTLPLINSNQSYTGNAGSTLLINAVSAPITVVTTGHSVAPFAGTYQDTLTWTITAN